MSTSYYPTIKSAQVQWGLAFIAALTAAPATYGLTAAQVAELAPLATNAENAFGVAQSPDRTAAQVAAMDTALADMALAYRPVAVAVSQNPNIADADKVTLGVTVRITSPSPVPAPTTAPALARASLGTQTLTITITQAGTQGIRAKPAGVVATEIRRTIGTAPAVSPDSADFALLATKATVTMGFASSDVGKTVTVWARYNTRSGPGGVAQVGPWSQAMVSVIA